MEGQIDLKHMKKAEIKALRPAVVTSLMGGMSVKVGGCKILSVKSEHLFAIRMPSVSSDRWALSELNDRTGVGCGADGAGC